jgi:hypothetical protein
MERFREILTISALLLTPVLRFVRAVWIPVVLMVVVLIAKSDEVRDRNYELCGAVALAAYASSLSSKGTAETFLLGTGASKGNLTIQHEDGLRVRCMLGKNYNENLLCAADALNGDETPKECFSRSLIGSIAAQVQ